MDGDDVKGSNPRRGRRSAWFALVVSTVVSTGIAADITTGLTVGRSTCGASAFADAHPPAPPAPPAGAPPPATPPESPAPPQPSPPDTPPPQTPAAPVDPVVDATRRARSGDLDGALALLERLAADPANVDARLLYVDLVLRKPAAGALLDPIRTWAAERPDDPLAQHMAARTLPPKKALPELQRLVLKFPDSPWPYLGRAQVLAQAGKLTEALRDYDQAVALSTDSVRFRIARALALEAAGRWPDALLDWKQVAAARPDDSAALVGMGEALRHLDDVEGAVAQLQAAAKLEPRDPEPVYRLALTYLDAAKYDEAVLACEQALALQPNAYHILCTASTVSLRKAAAAAATAKVRLTAKDIAPAIAYADRAIALDGDRPGAYMERGIARETAVGTPAEAQAALDAPADDGPPLGPAPGDAPPAGGASPPPVPGGGAPPAGPPSGGAPDGPPSGGAADGGASKPPAETPDALLELALADYTEAAARHPMPGPGLVRALLARAHVLRRLGRFDESASDALRAADVAPTDEAAWAVAGEALTLGGRPEDAVKRAWKPGLKAVPDSARLHHGYGITFWKLGRLTDALKELKESVKDAPTNGRYRLTYGEALYQASKEKDSVAELLEATGARPDDRESWACLGHAHVALHRWQEAADAYEEVCQIDPKAVDEHIYLAIIYADRLKMKDKGKLHAQIWSNRGGADPLLASWVDSLLNGK